MKRRLLAYGLGLGMFGVVADSGGSAVAFVDLPSMLLVLGGGVAFSLAALGFRPLARACVHAAQAIDGPGGAAVRGDRGVASLSQTVVLPADARQSAAALQTVRGAFWGSGVAGVLIGQVQMMQSLEDPSAIGPAVAVSVLSLLYAAFLAELIVAPLRGRLLYRAAASRA